MSAGVSGYHGSSFGGAYGHGNYAGYGYGHGGAFWHNGGNFNRFGYGYGGIWPYYWFPWFGLGGWYGYGYPWDYGYYDIYGYPGYGYGGYVADYDVAPYTTAYAAPADNTAAPPEQSPLAAEQGGAGTLGSKFLTSGREAFQKGDYHNAIRLAGHAAVEEPRSADVHDLLMLSLFASGDYRARPWRHAAASLGQPMHWETLYGFYGDIKPFTEQLRKLEKDVAAKPNDPAARFLLGYQYLMMGHNEAAKTELTESLLKAPRDRLAANLLTQIGGKIPESVLAIQKQMEKEMPKAGGAAGPPPPAPMPAPAGK